MKLNHLLEEFTTDHKMLAVVYPGRFQPFHLGHMGVWDSLKQTFGEGRLWLATSNKTNFKKDSDDVSPFNFNDKLSILYDLYGIAKNKIIKCESPLFPQKEILQKYNGPTVLIIVGGYKDENRFKNNDLFKPWPVKNNKPVKWEVFKNKAELLNGKNQTTTYYLIDDTEEVPGISGTLVRNKLLEVSTVNTKIKKLFLTFFGKWTEESQSLIMSRLKEVK